MLKHERYCGKWKGEGCCAGQRKCDGFQGAHLLFAAHCGKWTPPRWRKAGRAVISELLSGCRKAKGTQRSWHLGQNTGKVQGEGLG